MELGFHSQSGSNGLKQWDIETSATGTGPWTVRKSNQETYRSSSSAAVTAHKFELTTAVTTRYVALNVKVT